MPVEWEGLVACQSSGKVWCAVEWEGLAVEWDGLVCSRVGGPSVAVEWGGLVWQSSGVVWYGLYIGAVLQLMFQVTRKPSIDQ